MIELMKGACVVIALICLGAIIYAIYNAFETAKRNRAADEMSRQIFLSQMLQNQNIGNANTQIPANKTNIKTTAVESAKPKVLDYDKFENEVDLSAPSDKGLKDFFEQ